MKAAKRKRDPSKEPFASPPYSDDERRALDSTALLSEWERATRKSQSALEQKKRGEMLPFLNPQASDASARATADPAMEQITRKMVVVETLRAGQRKAGNDRARDMKADAYPKHKRIRDMATELLKSNTPREIVSLIVECGHTETTVRRALRTHPRGYWPGKTTKGATS